MNDRSSTAKRLAPIKPLIQRARMVAQETGALMRRVEKRFPGSALALTVETLDEEAKHAVILLETYQRNQPGSDDAGDFDH